MPLVLRKGRIELRILFEETTVHCYDGGMDSGIEVELDLQTLLVLGYGESKKLPTVEFLLEALLLAHENHELLLRSWKEINS